MIKRKHFIIPANVKHFFKFVFPTISLLFLLYFQNPILNPGGILALIPIFFYSIYYPELLPFIFVLFGLFFIDYSYGMNMYWLLFFLIIYLILDLQHVIDLKKQRYFSWLFFSIMCCLFFTISAIIIGTKYGIVFLIIKTIWALFLLVCLYVPFAYIFNRLSNGVIHDR